MGRRNRRKSRERQTEDVATGRNKKDVSRGCRSERCQTRADNVSVVSSLEPKLPGASHKATKGSRGMEGCIRILAGRQQVTRACMGFGIASTRIASRSQLWGPLQSPGQFDRGRGEVRDGHKSQEKRVTVALTAGSGRGGPPVCLNLIPRGRFSEQDVAGPECGWSVDRTDSVWRGIGAWRPWGTSQGCVGVAPKGWPCEPGG